MKVTLFFALLSLTFAGEPERCCYPEIWDAVGGSRGGFAGDSVLEVFHTEMKVYYNVVEQKFGIWSNQQFKTGEYEDAIWVYNFKTKRHIVFHKGQCYVAPFNFTGDLVPLCISKTAKYMGVETYGYGAKQMKTDAWKWTDVKGYTYYVNVLRDHCLPVSEVHTHMYRKKYKKYLSEEVDFLNLTVGYNKDDMLFEEIEEFLPSCDHRDKMPRDYSHMPQDIRFMMRRIQQSYNEAHGIEEEVEEEEDEPKKKEGEKGKPEIVTPEEVFNNKKTEKQEEDEADEDD